VYETVDRGRRWRRLVNVYFEPSRVRAGGLARYGYASGISFTASGRGLFWQSLGLSYLTRNGGRAWRPISATKPDVRIARSGWFVSDRVAYLLVQADDHELLRTRNGGRTWNLVRSWSRR
jgi:photosystem II stability/assembly factor-like uncharacterized protein